MDEEPKGKAKGWKNLELGRFKKGQVTNPKGRPKLIPDLQGIPTVTRDHIRKLMEARMMLPDEELQRMVKDPKVNGLDKMIIGNILMGRKNYGAFDFILNRTVGKVPDELEVSAKPRATIIKRPNGEEVLLDAEPIEKDDK